ncbi:MAG: hypothetical protein KIT80_03530 [Chitinophagaceae bacterium]|nr:hypothetical protein [Chitinophagaceae bacterium]MCW5925958.1 hypothetical protein [Chitinophagaceae bacterium]
MLAKVRTQNFIDTVTLELANAGLKLKAVLKDEVGKVCSILETDIAPTQKHISWDGLNELPYGIYLLELSCDSEEQKMRLVKRI